MDRINPNASTEITQLMLKGMEHSCYLERHQMQYFLKICFDKAFSLTALCMLLPLFIIIAIAIKSTSPGPVFFLQTRSGLNGKPFSIYKFRSMVVHQETAKITQATREDPRLTKIGNFLRRTSLDELPQFFNVLVGDMSVVGPRPHATCHDDFYSPLINTYPLRYRTKPGITGWAQINGCRGETDVLEKMVKRIEMDLHYIHHWSIWLDIKIVGWTAIKGWTGKAAY